MKTRTIVAAAAVVAVLGAGFAGAQVQLDPALASYKATSGVSGNVSSIGSDSLNNLNTIATGLTGTSRAIAYGGRAGGTDNAGVLWFGDNSGQLFLRSAGVGAPAAVPGWTGGTTSDIVLNPENWADAFVAAGAQVFHTIDAGGTFTDVTGNLATVAPGANVALAGMIFVGNGPNDLTGGGPGTHIHINTGTGGLGQHSPVCGRSRALEGGAAARHLSHHAAL